MSTPVVFQYQQALDAFRREGREPPLLMRMSELISLLDLSTTLGSTPEDLLGIGRLLCRLPEVSLWPEAALADWPAEAARCEMQRSELARIWSAERDAIVERLCDGNLSKTKAKPERVRTKWVAAIGDFLGRSELATPPEELEKLTPAWLSGATNKQKITPQHEFFERSAEFLGVWQGFESAVGGLRRRFADEARRRIEAAKQRRGLRSYSDLLTTLQRALDSERGADLVALLQRRYRAALIDEFQDTDPQQVRILGAAFGEVERALFQIGDPKQAIYAFRGADVHTYLEAAQSDPETGGWSLHAGDQLPFGSRIDPCAQPPLRRSSSSARSASRMRWLSASECTGFEHSIHIAR